MLFSLTICVFASKFWSNLFQFRDPDVKLFENHCSKHNMRLKVCLVTLQGDVPVCLHKCALSPSVWFCLINLNYWETGSHFYSYSFALHRSRHTVNYLFAYLLSWLLPLSKERNSKEAAQSVLPDWAVFCCRLFNWVGINRFGQFPPPAPLHKLQGGGE